MVLFSNVNQHNGIMSFCSQGISARACFPFLKVVLVFKKFKSTNLFYVNFNKPEDGVERPNLNIALCRLWCG